MRHKNSQKRLNINEGVFFITTITKNRYPYFKNMTFSKIFVEQLKLCKKIRDFRLYGFSLMHDHTHLLIHPGQGENISKIMHSIKRNCSRSINNTIGENNYSRVRNKYSHLTPYIDRFTTNTQCTPTDMKLKILPHFSWQSSFHDHLIRHDEDFKQHLSYIWINPEKHGMCDDYQKYPYSSFEYYHELIDDIYL